MIEPKFTVLLPVHRSPELLPYAIESVLAQKDAAFELFIICDGAPPATAECALAYASRDPRIRVFRFEKGQRHGEVHRNSALAEARAPLVAQIGDDDLWFPGHLRMLGSLLERVDFGHLLQAQLGTDGAMFVHTGDLADPTTRRRMCDEAWNFFGPSVAGYRLSAYRRLPHGWGPAPADVWTDLHMWRKFLARGDLTFGTMFAIEGLKLSAADRVGVPLSARAAELAVVAAQIADPTERRLLRARAFRALLERLNQSERASRESFEHLLASRQNEVDEIQAHLAQLNTRLVQSEAASAAIRSDHWALVESHDRMVASHSVLQATHDALANERDSALAAVRRVLTSKSWAVTKPLRWLRSSF